MSDWRKRVPMVFCTIYLIVQIALPLAALHQAHEQDRAVRYGWQMFSRVPPDSDE